MAQYPGQYGATPQATDEYGNPVHHGTTGATTGYGTATTGEHRKAGVMDKIKDKMQGGGGGHHTKPTDKHGNPVPQTRTDQYGNPVHHGTTGAPTGYGTATTGEHRKEGVMDKIKDKMQGRGGGHHTKATDKYGNPVPQTRTDQYGNPVHHGTTGATTGYGTATTGEHRKEGVMDKINDKMPGGGGGHHTQATDEYGNPVSQTRTDQYGNPVHNGATGATTGYGTATTGEHRKEGVMDKINHKMPGGGGGHHRDEDPYSAHSHTTSTTTTTAPYGGTTYTGDQHHEKKGMMEKIKDKLPGGNR